MVRGIAFIPLAMLLKIHRIRKLYVLWAVLVLKYTIGVCLEVISESKCREIYAMEGDTTENLVEDTDYFCLRTRAGTLGAPIWSVS